MKVIHQIFFHFRAFFLLSGYDGLASKHLPVPSGWMHTFPSPDLGPSPPDHLVITHIVDAAFRDAAPSLQDGVNGLLRLSPTAPPESLRYVWLLPTIAYAPL